MTDEAAQLAALRRVAYAREYPNAPANCDQQAVLDACDLAERLRQERDAAQKVWTELAALTSCSSPDGHAELDQVRLLIEARDAARAELTRIEALCIAVRDDGVRFLERAEAAEARVRALEAALQTMATTAGTWMDYSDIRTEAQRVLDGGGER